MKIDVFSTNLTWRFIILFDTRNLTHLASCVCCRLPCCIFVKDYAICPQAVDIQSLTTPCRDQTETHLAAYMPTCRGHAHQSVKISCLWVRPLSQSHIGSSGTANNMRRFVCSVTASTGCQGNKMIQVLLEDQHCIHHLRISRKFLFTKVQKMPQGLLCGLEWI